MRSRTSDGLTRLAIGGGLIVIGLFLLGRTGLYFMPWMLVRSAWPLGLVAAGGLLVAYGGRSTRGWGLLVAGIGLLFSLGAIGFLLWWSLTALWPIVLVVIGTLIAGAGLERLRGVA